MNFIALNWPYLILFVAIIAWLWFVFSTANEEGLERIEVGGEKVLAEKIRPDVYRVRLLSGIEILNVCSVCRMLILPMSGCRCSLKPAPQERTCQLKS